MALPDPSAWSPWIWALHVLGGLYLLGFFAAWFRFRAAEARVRRGGPQEEEAFNRAIRGFPWAFYAKMLGEHTYQASQTRGGDADADRSR